MSHILILFFQTLVDSGDADIGKSIAFQCFLYINLLLTLPAGF